MKIIFISIIAFSSTIFSQVFLEADRILFNEKIMFAEENNLSQFPLNTIIAEIGKSFINTPYEPHSLEITDEENLIINLRRLDCTTFLETTFALSLCIVNDKKSFEDFQSYLKLIRYRNGKIENYTSRLHYFSDWIYENQKKNLIIDKSKKIGGIPKKFKVEFMSNNPNLYKHLKNNPKFIPIIKQHEKEISKRIYFYLPSDKIAEVNDKIENGDFIALTTNQKGLILDMWG
jgi:hypothetical protein